MKERFGGETTLQSPILRAKVEATNLDKFGTTDPTQLPEIVEKRKQTCNMRYGTDNPMQNLLIVEKSVASRKTSYAEVVAKSRETMLQKHNVTNPMFVPEYVEKIKQTMLLRHGKAHAAQVPEFMAKMIQTTLERHGVKYGVQTKACVEKQHTKQSEVNKRFGKRLTDLGFDVQYEFPIFGKSYDIIIPELRTLIEVDPTYTHSVVGNHWNKSGISPIYHAEKTALAIENGFRCIHLFDWDDPNFLFDTLLCNRRIFAKTCEVLPIDFAVAHDFLSKYHYVGSVSDATYSMGLYWGDELVQVMCIGIPTAGTDAEWELLRFCSVPHTSVVGGASKLFSHMVSEYHLHNVVAYCDISKYTGGTYLNMGMRLHHVTPPTLHWSHNHDTVADLDLVHLNLLDILDTFDPDVPADTQMLNAGWRPVYDCGIAVYVFGDCQFMETPTQFVDFNGMLQGMKQRKLRRCAYCGKEFVPNSNHQKYCAGPHYQECPVCGKSFLVTNHDKLSLPPTACSPECRRERIRLSHQQRNAVKP